MKRQYIILMADIVASSKAPQPSTQKIFKKHIADVNKKFPANILSPLTITLGDEFQSVVKNYKAAMDIIFHLEETLIFENTPYKLRYVVNQGKIDTEINSENAYGMVGSGLTEARKLLERMKKKKHRFYFAKNGEIIEKYDGMGDLLELFYNKWEMKKEGDLVRRLLGGSDYKTVAAALHKTPSLIWKRRKSFEIDAYLSLKKLIYALI